MKGSSIESQRRRKTCVMYLATGLLPPVVAAKMGVAESYVVNIKQSCGLDIQALYNDPGKLSSELLKEAGLDYAFALSVVCKALGDDPTKADHRTLTLIAQALKNVDAIKPKAAAQPQAKTPAKPTL